MFTMKMTHSIPEWAGIAVPFVTRFPGNPLDTEKMRDEIVQARIASLPRLIQPLTNTDALRLRLRKTKWASVSEARP
jgi:hypothetical protein